MFDSFNFNFNLVNTENCTLRIFLQNEQLGIAEKNTIFILQVSSPLLSLQVLHFIFVKFKRNQINKTIQLEKCFKFL